MEENTSRAGFFAAFGAIARTELTLLQRFPRLWLAVLAIVIVPSVYALIYLTSVWDPNAKTNELPVGLVNLDDGFSQRGRTLNVGAELSAELIQSGAFGFRPMRDPQAAREAVRLGQLAFAVIIPPEFSANAVPGLKPRAGLVTVVLSEGNNYAAAGYARRFAEDLGHQVNEALNEKRWEQVLVSADGSGKSLEKLRAGMAQLRVNAASLQDGVQRYNAAAAQLGTGLMQVGAGLREIETRLPPEADLKQLRAGTQRLVTRQGELGSGLEQLQGGARKLAQGVTQLQEQSAGVPIWGDKLAAGAGELGGGAHQLIEGLSSALDANARLARGAARIDANTDKLVGGITALGNSLHQLTDKLPEDSRLEAFQRGGDDLARGGNRLLTGIDLVSTALPASLGSIGGSARGLADSVAPALEVLAPVPNNGSAFVPNMVAMALWLGAVMAVYLLNLRQLPLIHADVPALASTLGKFVLPALVVLLQAGALLLTLIVGLDIHIPHLSHFALTLAGAALTFLAVVFLLLRAFGEAGKLLAVLLLTLQLAAGGGVMPIELSGDFFQAVHDWLPFTWVIKTFRASLFGAFGGGWQQAYAAVLLIGATALLLASLIGRWTMVAPDDYKPGIDI